MLHNASSLRGLGHMINTKGFLHITIGVTDLERATAFYQNVLGCELVRRNPIMSFMKTGDDFFVLTNTGVHVPPNPDGPIGLSNTLFHHAMIVAPDQFDKAIASLDAQGIAHYDCTQDGHSTFPGRRHMYIKDPDGNSIELASEVMPELL
ncbi:MAG TPA: VOC family protein [Candidatus Acidoferrales bacterium]|nr:VOC family protein [Candidatus Acidoferrales bacterium]